MSSLWLIWAQLALCAGAIAVAGTLLSRYADVIADKTGWSGAWVGLVLLATVTSLPELATGISSVTLADAPDVAVGNVLGACVLNLSYVAVLDVLKRDEPLFQRDPGARPAGLVGDHIGIAGQQGAGDGDRSAAQGELGPDHPDIRHAAPRMGTLAPDSPIVVT